MPSFSTRHYPSDRYRSLSAPSDDLMEDVIPTTHHHSKSSTSPFDLVPSDGSLLDYFDLPSPPSTPLRQTHHSLSYSSLNSFPSPTSTPGLLSRSPGRSGTLSRSSSVSSSPRASPPASSPPRWPTAAQRIPRLSARPRSRSVSSSSSSSSYSALGGAEMDVDMTGLETSRTGGAIAGAPYVRSARRTPYYPPNASRNVDHRRVYMNRGPHFIPNWTPLSSLPRHVQLQIEERMVQFTAD
ncbi:hypothetical protein VTI74DRAFT_596 [Chaetomium olivicolor]